MIRHCAHRKRPHAARQRARASRKLKEPRTLAAMAVVVEYDGEVVISRVPEAQSDGRYNSPNRRRVNGPVIGVASPIIYAYFGLDAVIRLRTRQQQGSQIMHIMQGYQSTDLGT